MQALMQKMKKMLAQVKKLFPRANYQKPGIYPSRDWNVVLITFLVALVFFGAYALYINATISNGGFWSVTSNDQTLPIHKINQDTLDKVIQYFSDKAAHLDDAMTKPSTLADPSL